MKTLIIGANGQIGQKLVAKLKNSTHTSIAMVRSEDQVSKFKEMGVETVLADLEKDFSFAMEGIEAVVFTAGSGGHTGADKTHLIDRLGAKKAVDNAIKNNVNRFVMVSTLGAGLKPDEWPEGMKHYFEAKADADQHLMQSSLNYTILRPGSLTNENGTGNVTLVEELGSMNGEITRTDVATVLAQVLDNDDTSMKILEVINGDTPVDVALEELA